MRVVGEVGERVWELVRLWEQGRGPRSVNERGFYAVGEELKLVWELVVLGRLVLGFAQPVWALAWVLAHGPVLELAQELATASLLW